MRDNDMKFSRTRGYRLFPAVVVIAIGVLFLTRNLGVAMPFFDTRNWWAWLILVAAVAPLARAVELYRANGGFNGAVLHHLFVAAAVIAVAGMFLLDLDWRQWWPLFVILGGVNMLARDGKCCGRSTSA